MLRITGRDAGSLMQEGDPTVKSHSTGKRQAGSQARSAQSQRRSTKLRNLGWQELIILTILWRVMQPPPAADIRVIRALIISVSLMLVVVALVAVGAPQVVSQVLAHWPLIP